MLGGNFWVDCICLDVKTASSIENVYFVAEGVSRQNAGGLLVSVISTEVPPGFHLDNSHSEHESLPINWKVEEPAQIDLLLV